MKKMADMMSKAGKWLLVFGIVISQLSFPLQVLAEEVLDNTNEDVVVDDTVVIENEEDSNVVTVNYDELTSNEYEYTINSDELSVTFSLQSQDIVEEITLDFSKRLYGEYRYTLEGTDKVLVIKYVGNNIDLLNNYKNVVDLTKELTCNESECIINGFGTDLVKVSDVLGYYDIEAFASYYNASVEVTDGENVLTSEEVVVNGYKLVIKALEEEELVNVTPNTLYTINRVGDIHIPSDGLINELDQETVLDDILLENELTETNDINGDGVLNILDATDSTFMDIYNGEEVDDVLTNTLVLSNEEVLIGDTVEVKLLVSGFNKALIYGIEGLLNYDSNILELVGATLYVSEANTLEDLGYLNLENGKFAYVLLNGFNSTEEAILTLEFEALAEGNVDVTISNIIESYGEAFELTNDNTKVSFVVGNPEDNKGGDVPEDETPEEDKKPEEDTTTDSNEGVVGGTTTEVDKETTVPVVTPVVKSSDYYIKNLEIKGYDIDFDMNTYEYTIKVKKDVTSLDFDVLLNSSKSIYYVEGNENFKEGENLVHLVVKAENGSTKTYTIKVVKEATDEDKEVVKDNATELEEEEEEEENSASKTVIIILIILVIIGLIYVIFKDDEEDNKDNKKQEKTVPKKSESVKVEKVENKATKNTNNTKSTKNTKNNNSTKKNTKKGSKK